mgnify:CR=1 FL=1
MVSWRGHKNVVLVFNYSSLKPQWQGRGVNKRGPQLFWSVSRLAGQHGPGRVAQPLPYWRSNRPGAIMRGSGEWGQSPEQIQGVAALTSLMVTSSWSPYTAQTVQWSWNKSPLCKNGLNLLYCTLKAGNKILVHRKMAREVQVLLRSRRKQIEQ